MGALLDNDATSVLSRGVSGVLADAAAYAVAVDAALYPSDLWHLARCFHVGVGGGWKCLGQMRQGLDRALFPLTRRGR